ncbi:unnamed protein product, partial [marine sediment metagenome]
WKIISLRRHNILRQAISDIVAKDRGAHHHRLSDGPLELDKMNIDCNKLINVIKWFEKLSAQESKILENLPHLSIIYEDDLLKTEHHQKTLDRIFDYLGIPSVPVKTQFVKITPNRLSDFVLNHKEIMQTIGEAEYV